MFVFQQSHLAEELRRASPLWLRFVGDDRTGEWRLFSFVFLNRFKPESALVRHNKKPVRRLTVTDEHVDKSAVDWLRYTSVPVGEAPEPPR